MATTVPLRPSRQIDLTLLIIRFAVGLIFVAHGAQKLFVFGIGGTTSGFTQFGVPMATTVAPIVTVVELLGGAALIIGLLTRLAALCLAADMVGAILIVHAKNGFFLPTGFEFTFLLCTVAIGLILSGAGSFSVDAVIADRRTRR